MMDIYLLKSELPIYDSYLCQYLAIKGGSSGFFFGGGGEEINRLFGKDIIEFFFFLIVQFL